MKIIKNILLLIVLFVFASSVYIATQAGTYSVSRFRIISLPRTTLFNYVNDYRNWESFGSWNSENSNLKFTYPKKTIGIGASYTWEGTNGSGTMQTIFVKENEALHQKMNFNGSKSEVYWSFKDTLGGTKVTWESSGTMDFGFKIYAAFNGGAEKIIGAMYEKSLLKLDKKLHFEIASYSIKIKGIVKKTGTYYLKQTITSTLSNLQKNVRIVLFNTINLFKKNNLVMNGNPFIIYHRFDSPKGIVQFSICIPIKEAAFTSSGSQVTSGELMPFQAVKTTLRGDNSHRKTAWEKTVAYCKKNNLILDDQLPIIEEYLIHSDSVSSPSKWVTEIYIPVKPLTNLSETASLPISESLQSTVEKKNSK